MGHEHSYESVDVVGAPDFDPFSEMFPARVGSGAVPIAEAMFPLLPIEEEIVTRASMKRRIEFSAGRYCARLAMARLGHSEWPVRRRQDRVPIWPPGLVGSITHTADYCAAVVASRDDFGALGIDVEQVGAVPSDLAEQILRREEFVPDCRPYLGDIGADWLTLHFCLKEAAYKAFYTIFEQIIEFSDMLIDLDVDRMIFVASVPAIRGPSKFDGKFMVKNGKIFAASWKLSD
ncbi:MAG TPA: 4'-phosphopantetheinyl transferase superfamily protein [Rhizomicrobium sp.]|nr:4'-phosphopantetheinyl transferase superfamily protein [Rhizomicrobium sp.]